MKEEEGKKYVNVKKSAHANMKPIYRTSHIHPCSINQIACK